ncbi:MAG TPA: SAM-dependent methyltransferase [Candidatus Acidoferrales bacterium]|jgi:methyltransferase (TIGR00027 family)|nr:SAM-dependent methyltransferase [Candidatus Acidoferrales bacterium]
MADSLIENVSDTAFWVAYYRAVETRRPDALFQDPLAGVLAGEQGKKIAETMPMRFMTSWVIAIRTRIIDEYIQMAIADGVEAVVNLGAGLDARPYRMDLPKSFLWIEADYPRMIDYKESRLRNEAPRCTLQRVPVDLANPAERRKLLTDVEAKGKKLLILTEGLIPYLSVEEVGALADDLKAMSYVRYWITEYLSRIAIKFRERGGISRKTRNAPFKFKPADWFGFFREHGWAVKEMRYFSQEGERLKRPVRAPLLLKVIMKVRTLLASKENRQALKKVAGYALLEPANTSGSR